MQAIIQTILLLQAKASAVTDIHHQCMAFSVKGFHLTVTCLFNFQQEPCPGIHHWAAGLCTDAAALCLWGLCWHRPRVHQQQNPPAISFLYERCGEAVMGWREGFRLDYLVPALPCSVWKWESYRHEGQEIYTPQRVSMLAGNIYICNYWNDDCDFNVVMQMDHWFI